jgi:hypothetical protein
LEKHFRGAPCFCLGTGKCAVNKVAETC